jgi:hypothetical protein
MGSMPLWSVTLPLPDYGRVPVTQHLVLFGGEMGSELISRQREPF